MLTTTLHAVSDLLMIGGGAWIWFGKLKEKRLRFASGLIALGAAINILLWLK